MKYGLYTIKDRVAEMGGFPFTSRNDGTAARSFRDFMNRQDVTVHDPADFQLLKIGLWDEDTCLISACEPIYIEVTLPPRGE